MIIGLEFIWSIASFMPFARFKNTLAFFLLCLSSLTLLSLQPVNAQTDKVTLQLKWFHQFQFAGYYAAQKKGYYAEQGIEVDIRERVPYKNNIEQVIEGKADYGISDSILLLYRAKKAPIVIVAPIFQHSPQVLITLKSSGIDSPYKLKNKRIAFYPKDTDGFSILAMSHQIGVETLLDRIYIKTDPGMLLRNEADAYASYLTNEPYFFKSQGIDINIIKPMHYGIDLYGDMLFTSEKELQNHPERVKAFREASIKGWQYALENKREIAQYILDTYQPKDKTLEHLLFEANAIEDMMSANSTPIGTLDSGRIAYISQLFQKHGLIDNKLDLSEGIYQPENRVLSFTATEKAWLEKNNTIRLGIDHHWHPIDFVDPNGVFSGMSADLIKYLSKKTGLNFEFDSELSWSETIRLAKAGKIDVLSAVIPTDARKHFLNFSMPYLKLSMGIATQAGEPYIADLSTLEYKTIVTVKNYASEALLRKNFPNINITLAENPQEALELVANGLAYGYVDNVAVISHHIQASGMTSIQISGEMPFKSDISLGIHKDQPELFNILQKVLSHMTENEINQIRSNWLQVKYKKDVDIQSIAIIVGPLALFTLVILFFFYKLSRTQQALSIKNQELKQAAITDHLTLIYNRKHLDESLLQEIARTNRYGNALSIILLDLDYFKKINDSYGHDTGDAVLQKLCRLIEDEIRETDIFGRWGGEEFLLICPNTNLSQAYEMAEKIRISVLKHPIHNDITITLSLGIAEFDLGEKANNFIKRADDCLYIAKAKGRNRAIFQRQTLS